MLRIFGHIAGVPPGSTWHTRREVAAAGVHKPTMNGISGTDREGADSVVVSGGYEDDEDHGTEIIYTGTGGYNPASGKQTSDQTLENTNNAALVVSRLRGLPVRVVRGANGDKTYSPATGYRYDGLFKVVDHWSEIGESGFRIWRFRLEQDEVLDTQSGAIHPPTGNKRPGRTSSSAVRVIRTTGVSEHVKAMYDFACQICGVQIPVPKGRYAEGAHIKGLGRPHNGPDIIANVLCLCPNHHAAFDLGGIYIDEHFVAREFGGKIIGPLRIDQRHGIDPEFIRYHRSLWER